MGDKNVKFKHMASYDIEYEENFIRAVQFVWIKIKLLRGRVILIY